MKYKSIMIDPPWDISMAGKVKLRHKRATKLTYKTMTLEEIKKFPISDFADIGCHVYAWTTNKMLKHIWDVFESWGVNFHLVLPWVKNNGIAPCFAYKFASEFCVLGFFGKPMQKFNKSCKLNWINTPAPTVGNHSVKPDEFYELIKAMSPEPRIDIFARKTHDGFDQWGDEAENTIGKNIENKTLCKECGFSAKNSDDYEAHLTRTFHLNSIGELI